MSTLDSGYFGTGLRSIKLNILLFFTLNDSKLSVLKEASVSLINIFVNIIPILGCIYF